ncbi:MAG: tRNA guanosine(34) transglycosylase Tgt [Chloroflexi bacterium]|nr:tRNA guanosine(34) transglycosylase Tgt [Chloroflexota bacterium]
MAEGKPKPPAFGFVVDATCGATGARAGRFCTPHGIVETPAFLPVGTQATVKALDGADLHDLAAPMVLANTYHLYLRPGTEVVAHFGGLHRFMGWPGPILTDSGGFQVFSLRQRRSRGTARGVSPLVRIDDDGVTFRSHLDGSTHRFTPERAIDAQVALGADVIMAFDECSPNDDDRAYAEASLARTHAWAIRCRRRWAAHEAARTNGSPQALFAIVQGGNFRDLREQSAHFIADLDLPGVAIGGESIGFSKSLTRQILEWVVPLLPADRPRYAMGIGAPDDFLAAVARGVDLFDSVLPTRLARNGSLLTADGRLPILNARYARDPAPPESGCGCPTCQRFSRAYLRHLFKSGELLAHRLATIHNLHFCISLMRRVRASIVGGEFPRFHDRVLDRFTYPLPRNSLPADPLPWPR